MTSASRSRPERRPAAGEDWPLPQGAAASLLGLQAFVNTVDLAAGEDALSTPEKAAAWLVTKGLLAPPMPLSWADRERLVDLRETLRALLRVNAGAAPDVAAAARLEAEAARTPLRLRLDGGGVAVVAAGGGLDGAVGSLLAALAVAAAEGSWQRLKACADPSCRAAFYDHSRNRARRWCSMAVCGNRAKARRFRGRHPRPGLPGVANGRLMDSGSLPA